MRTKILNALKTAYANLGLSDKAFDGVASFLEKTVTKEEDINDAIKDEGIKNLLKAFQGESDSLRNRASQLQKDFDAYKAAHPETNPNTPPTPPAADEPEWARKLREQNEIIMGEFERRDAAQKQQATAANVKAALEKAGCNNPGILRLTLKGFALGENETEEDAVKRLTGDYNQNIKESFGDGVVPPIGVGVPTQDPSKYADKMNTYLEQQGLLPKQQ